MAKSLKNLQANVPQANLESYVVTLYGRPKVGKTSLFYKVTKAHYKGDLSKGLLLGFEKGYGALKGIYAQDISTFEDFISVVDELVTDHDELPFKLVAMDTVDQMYKMAADYVVKREKIKDKKTYKDISDIPWGAGYSMTAEAIYTQVDRLLKIGLGVWFITHDQDKQFESRDGHKYDKTTVSLPKRARDIVINMSDFVIFIDNAKVPDGEGKLRDERYIYFRAEGSEIEAGSRFANIVPRIVYDENLFLEAFEDAVLSEVGDQKSVDKLKKEQAKEREERAKEYVESETSNLTAGELTLAIEEKVKGLSADQRKEVGAQFKEILGGSANYKVVEDAELLQQCLTAVNSIAH